MIYEHIFKIEHPDYFTTFVDKELLFKSRNTSIDMQDIPIKRKGMENKEHMLGEIVVNRFRWLFKPPKTRK